MTSTIPLALKKVLQAIRRERERKALDGAISRYYSSLSRTEAHELTEWGVFAEREFPIAERLLISES